MNNIQRLKVNERALMDALKAAGVATIHAEFEGSGDSGSLDEVEFFHAPAEDTDGASAQTAEVEGFTVSQVVVKSTFDDAAKEWKNFEVSEAVSLVEATKDYIYTRLEATGIDWYNNEGGYGTIAITLDPFRVETEISTRYTEVDTHIFDTDDEKEAA